MNQISLQTDLGIECVAELQAALQVHLDDDAPLAIAGDRVERVHAAGLQLLHAFVRDRAARGHQTTVTVASPTLAAAARPLALAVSLGVDDAMDLEQSELGINATFAPTLALPRVAEEGNQRALDEVECRVPNGEPA
jgi:ABC-type transporter Mla MlaB component